MRERERRTKRQTDRQTDKKDRQREKTEKTAIQFKCSRLKIMVEMCDTRGKMKNESCYNECRLTAFSMGRTVLATATSTF